MTLYPALKNKSEEWGGEWYREGKEREMPAELSLKLRPLPLLSCLKRNACMPSSSFPLHPPVPLPPDPEFHRAHMSLSKCITHLPSSLITPFQGPPAPARAGLLPAS